MKIDELIEKLKEIKEKAEFHRIASIITIHESDGTWIGEFDLDDVQYNEGSHCVELMCKGKRTNFIHNERKEV